MILPIYAYGQPVLKRVAGEIAPDHPDLEALIANMWETMYHASGVGLAGPQVGLPLRIFVVDTIQIKDQEKIKEGIKEVFLNATILSEEGDAWGYEEGCLSIPDVRGEVQRPARVRLRWQDTHFEWHEREFDGMNARVIQHEYDHIEGILFVERLKPLKKRLIKRRLEAIRMGQVSADYRLRFATRPV